MVRKADYDTTHVLSEATRLNLHVDHDMLNLFIAESKELGFSQATFNRVLELHMKAVIRSIDRKVWPWKTRLLIALYWLGLTRDFR